MAAPNSKYSVLLLPHLFFTSTLQFLLVGAQKYFSPRRKVPSSYASGIASEGTCPEAQVLGAH